MTEPFCRKSFTKKMKPKFFIESIAKLETLLDEEECDAETAKNIRRQIRDLKVAAEFSEGQKQLCNFTIPSVTSVSAQEATP